MTNIQGNKYPDSYLKGIENETFKRIDNAGNKDGKVTVDEAYKDLDIPGLLSGQNEQDAAKIKKASANIKSVLERYAGNDGIFSAQEWADFLNGDEWDAVMDSWHSSGKKAELEMKWTDMEHIQDRRITKGEVKVGILNNLLFKNINVNTKNIEILIDKYAGNDGTFTLKEYQAMKNDPEYKNFIEKYNVVPWFNIFKH